MISPNPAPAGPDVTPNDRLFAALSYLLTPIVNIIVLLLEDTKNRPYPRYHAIQGLGFFVAAWVVGEILITILFTVLSVITLGCGALCLWILFFLPAVPAVYYTYLAGKQPGSYFAIPWLTEFMIKQGWLSRP